MAMLSPTVLLCLPWPSQNVCLPPCFAVVWKMTVLQSVRTGGEGNPSRRRPAMDFLVKKETEYPATDNQSICVIFRDR